ncbi:hypothetical protein B7494_g2779 [Chlorociboria aeruginascens]|nr:hypothetical protein B7494_g2779 [Chlorociboria aeruginascens]
MASTSLPNQSFVYDELPDHSIRLLDILEQENEPNNVALRLKTYQLKNAPDFNALSYVWGQSTDKYQVPCWSERDSHAGLITITSNLFNALPFLKAASSRPIWIDAVCINQGSQEEPSKVVPMMGEYYGKAAEVLIWLGEKSDGSDLAMDMLKWMWFPRQRELLQHTICKPHGSLEPSQLSSIFKILRDGTKLMIAATDTMRLGIPRVEHDLWFALPALYRRDWFFRVWTFQEIMLAKNATVLCGDRAIPWTAFQHLGDKLSDTQLLWISRPFGQDRFSPLRDLQHPHKNGEWFWTYLQGARDRSCRFKEDRIFGMLALAPQSIQTKIKVVYHNEDPDYYIQVYRAATIAFLEELPLETVLTAAPSSGKAEKMPSWCPDWSLRNNPNAPQARFKADITHFALRGWSVDPLDHGILVVRGQQIDIVKEVIDDYSYYWPNGISGIDGPADKMLQWLNHCEALTRRTVASDEAATDAYWKTLLSYSDIHNQFNFPPDPVRGLAAHRRRLAESRDSIPLAQTTLSSEDLQALGPFLAYIGVLWPGKVFFSTKEGTIGLGDKGIAAGDSICLFFNACKHFVLGHFDDGTNDVNLKSVAYVHGMMGDVAAAMRLRNGDTPLEESARMFRIR